MKKQHWRVNAVAIATAVLLGVSASDASALALGRVTVQSALGEPLRAEIEIPQISADEMASLRTAIASPEAFRAAGFDYHPAIANIQIALQRRPDGRHFLRLSSQRPVTDPFIDLILEANWSSGRVVRDYTMLFDPPNLRESAPAVATQVSPAAPTGRSQAAPKTRAPAAEREPASKAIASKENAAKANAAKATAGDGKQVKVQSGDTAGAIAAANKPTSVSLDQMLVALLRGNPEAFIGGNVNRLKAGAVLDMPTAEEAGAVPREEASQNIIAQSRDFNDFRRRLAEGLPTTRVGGGERQSSGRVQAQVEEKKPAATAPDKLTLSKGALQGKVAADKIARDRAAQDDAKRLAELNKNISELNKLGTATAPATGAASTPKTGVAPPPGIPGAAKPASSPAAALPITSPSAATDASAPAAASITAGAVQTILPASAPAPAATPALAASAPASAAGDTAVAAAAPAASAAASAVPGPVSADAVVAATAALPASKPRVATPPPPETSLVDDLVENPIVPATVGGVLALLLGFGFYRAQQRKKSTQVDSSFLESRLQPDSFFGASGGQRIDTNESSSNATGSSMVYSPSQLDAAGDVDPVAEADVYLAYGRDLQAEEILKEAMRTTPQRVAVHSKLLEIYSKRRDTKSFELIATEAYGLTRGEGPEWAHICELGKDLDASNSLYRPGGHPASSAAASGATKRATDFSPQATQAIAVAAKPEKPVDLDLDLDFSLGDDSPAPVAHSPVAPRPTLSAERPVAEPKPSLDRNFGSATVALKPAAAPERSVAPAPSAKAGMIEFDLGALSLDLDSATAKVSPATRARAPRIEEPVSSGGAPLSTAGLEGDGGDPLATKLALAQEFNAIGDPDGARSLAQEVLAEASGDLKQKAQRFLAEIA